MLTLLIGPDWVANRDAVLKMLAQDVQDKKPGRILIVPELISHDTERRLSIAAGDTASRYAEVLSFKRLARRVADSVGHAAQECLDNGGRIVAMASAVYQLHSKLKAYAGVETRPEFLQGLVDAVDEFKRCCIRSADLKAAAAQTEGSLAQKLEELALILESYDSVCAQGKRDPGDQMTWLLDELESGSFAEEHTFYIDGFPDFTRQHMAILNHLIKESKNVVVSLNCDCPGSALLSFEKTGETATDLLREAKRHGVETVISHIPARNNPVSVVRDQLFQGRIESILSEDCLRVCRTDTVYQECLAAAERILSLVHKGVRYRDVGIVCSDPASYGVTLEIVLDRCHIPAYFSGTDPILSKSVITTVLAALDTALSGFESQDVLRYLKSSLSPLDDHLCDLVENYALLWSINGSLWLKPWENHPGGLGMDWDANARAMLETLESARVMAIEPLAELKKAFYDAKTLGHQVIALYDFFCRIDLAGRLDSIAKDLDTDGDNRNAQILSQLWDILVGALEQLYDVLGQTAWDPDTFCRLFKLLLSQYDVGTIPTVLDSVVVGPVNFMRCQQSKHLIVLGALEGNLPGYRGSTGVLSDNERTALRSMGVPLTGGAMDGLKADFSEIYGAFCGAELSVTVSCPSGQPSFVYRRLQEMAGGEQELKPTLGAALADPTEAGAFFARYGAEEEAAHAGVLAQYHQIKRCAEHSLGAISHENIGELYGKKLNLSASQIDKLADCRFHYFLRYGIRAKELKPVNVDPAEFGTYVHAVLENTARRVCDMGGFGSVSQEQILQIARQYSDAYTLERFGQLSADRVQYLFNRNVQELEQIVLELWDELRQSEFAPVGFEVSFGDNGIMPAVDCSGTALQAQLRGFVDRVDKWTDGEKNYFRVVDYKTGRKDFDYCDVFNGLGLQMLLYLFALEQHGEKFLGEDPLPAGVQYFPARVPLVSTDGRVSDEESSRLKEKNWKRRGLLLAQDAVLSAMGPEETAFRMPFSRKKDGTVSGDVADSKQFELLKCYIFNLLKKMVDDIQSGNIEPNPYTRGSSHNACTFCPYGAVCHSASVENRRNYKAMSAQQFWECVQQEVTQDG